MESINELCQIVFFNVIEVQIKYCNNGKGIYYEINRVDLVYKIKVVDQESDQRKVVQFYQYQGVIF